MVGADGRLDWGWGQRRSLAEHSKDDEDEGRTTMTWPEVKSNRGGKCKLPEDDFQFLSTFGKHRDSGEGGGISDRGEGKGG